jgi:hypothetical protein
MAGRGGVRVVRWRRQQSDSVRLSLPPLPDLPSDVPVPLHARDRPSVGWSDLLHLRYNVAMRWTRALPPVLTRLTSLHLLADLQNPALSEDDAIAFSTTHLIRPCIDEALQALPNLTQLTLTLRCPAPRLAGDVRPDLSALQGGEGWVHVDLTAFNCLPQLTFLYLDLGGFDDRNDYYNVEQLLYNDFPWRRRLQYLGLALSYEEVMRVARYWHQRTPWPSLKECHIGLSSWLDNAEMQHHYRWDKEQRALSAAVMQRVVGKKLWVSRERLMSHRVDHQWMTAHDLRALTI